MRLSLGGGIGILQCAISSFPAPAKHDTFHAAAWAAFDSDILQARSQWCLLLKVVCPPAIFDHVLSLLVVYY